MTSQCQICGLLSESRELNTCCWKIVCSTHNTETCELCGKKRTRFPYLKTNCERCSASRIEIYCDTCRTFLCNQCNEMIHSKGKYLNHKVKKSDPSFSLICGKHGVQFNSFCSICSFCCINCKCPHNKQNLKETEKASKALQGKYCKILNEKIDNLKNIEKGFSLTFIKNLEVLENERFEAKAEFDDLIRKISEKRDLTLDAISKIIKSYSETCESTLADIAEDLKGLDMLFNLFSVPIPIHSLIVTIPEHELFKVTDKKEYRMPEVDLGVRVSISPVFQAFDQIYNERPSDSSRLINSRPSLSRESLHKRLDSQDLPPRPSSGRSSIITRQNSGKNLSCGRSPIPEEDIIIKDSLSKRTFIKSAQSSTSIKLSWTHPLVVSENLEYQLDCSLDKQEFRQVYKGKPKTCIITELAPNTSYFFKVTPIVADTKGETSEVLEIKTFGNQGIDPKSLGSFAVFENESIEFRSNGSIFGQFPYLFGKHYWELTIKPSGQFSGFVKIGVSTQERKTIIGRSILCSKNESTVRVMLDMDNGLLVFFDSSLLEEDALKVPQDLALYSAFQLKSGKNSQASLKLDVIFHNEYT